VLETNECKDIIVNSLKFLVNEKRVSVYGFVIMPNHIHLIWKVSMNHKRSDVQRDFLKFTGQQIKFQLQKDNPELLQKLKVDLKDREYQIWQRNPLSIELYTNFITEKKLNYIHNNPCAGKWNLSSTPEGYFYSSSRFYLENDLDFSFIRNYMDE
jgi:REP element-mobilizing transposase RayT